MDQQIEKPKEDIYLSVSKASCFTECKARYKYAYVIKIPQKDNIYTIFGSFCHLVLEKFHLAYLEGSQDPYNIEMTKAWKFAWQQYKVKMTSEMKKDCRAIIDEYLQIITNDKKNNLSANVIAAEQKFKFPIDDGKIILNGMIDRIQIDADNVPHIGDYKTAKSEKYLGQGINLQLLTYGYYALNILFPEADKVRCSYILLRHNFKYKTYEFTRAEVKKVEDYYIKYRDDILGEKAYPTTTSPLCTYCPYLNLCEDGQKKAKVFSGEVEW